ncbi:hypothetical protein Prudu_002333 [Prunus dulcis]|uniref:Uncharacterized protein n=1 Tax=Prunus dulcis TaxID=3755 RepID=A0A4Y1QQI0_PRUDU|nr:hypothetical protein Prudu_002333 [Prunus dulcis]
MKKSVQFGKIQKQIKCEFVDSQALNYDQEKSTANHTAPRLAVSGLGGGQKAVAELDETIPDEYDGSDVELVGPELDDAIDNMQRADCDFDDSSLDTWEETILDEYEGSDVELLSKSKEEKLPHRKPLLKVKEKAVLNDVFSKYGAKATLATREDS